MGAPGAGNVAKSFAESTLILPLGGVALEQKIITMPLVVRQKLDFLRRTTVVAAITAIVRNVFRGKPEGQIPERVRLSGVALSAYKEYLAQLGP